MNKHLSMLFAAAVVLSAAPAYAACLYTSPPPCEEITKVLTAPIDTENAGGTGVPEAIQIDSGGGVNISKASAAVTVNSNDWVANDGAINNNNVTGAEGIVIDAGGLTNTINMTSNGVGNNSVLNLTGSGNTKTGILVTDGTAIGPIVLGANSVIKVNGDGSNGVEIGSTGVLEGDVTLDGSVAMTPTTPSALSTTSFSSIFYLAQGGVLDGNLTVNPTGVLTSTGASAEGLLIDGPINASMTTGTIGTLTNAGTIEVSGPAITATPSTSTSGLPEGGSALVVSANVAGGIVNAGPADQTTLTTIPVALLRGSGYTYQTSGAGSPLSINAVVSIVAPSLPVTIGADTLDSGSNKASFINRGSIVARPSDANHSTTAINIEGAASTALTTLTGGFFSSGAISAVATSTSGTGSANVSATGIFFNDWSKVPTVEISGLSASSGSTLGTVSASVSGGAGGKANGIVFGTFANGGDPNAGTTNVGTTKIKIDQNASVSAVATTTNPNTVSTLDAVAILDESGTVQEIDNAGSITAISTTLTPTHPTAVSNFQRAIDLSSNTVGGITLNNSGSISGDVLLNSSQSGTTGTIVNIGAGSATNSGDPQQVIEAGDAASATGHTNTGAIGGQAFLSGSIAFGTGTSNLYINDYGSLTGAVLSPNGATLGVDVSQLGKLSVENSYTTGTMNVQSLNVYGGGLGISLDDLMAQHGIAVITADSASGMVDIAHGTKLGFSFASFVPQGLNQFILIQGPVAGFPEPPDMATYQQSSENNLPFYFERNSACEAGTDLSHCALQFRINQPTGSNELVLNVTPKTSAELGLTGDAKTMFPFANMALVSDPALGAAVVNGIGSNADAEKIYSQFAPDISGNERAIAIALTDEATGPVAARQRLLRMYANQGGDLTLWGQEYGQFINDKGSLANGGLNNNKDHGFGFTIGADSGDPLDGWYGAAFTFFSGDASETLPRDAKAQTEWFMLTGYTDWRGHHLFLDTQASAGLGNIIGKRFIDITDPTTQLTEISREADSKRAGLLGAVGATTGAIFNWGNLVLMPEVSLDGMTMREEGYTETGGGESPTQDGFDLKVEPYYATSLRTFVGADSRIDVDLGDFLLQPEARLGYRFDFLNDPVKVRGAFVGDPTDTFSITGPDPSRGNVVAGATLGASTETWSMGANFDWIRGSNGSTTEVGTFSLLGRI